GNFVPRSVAPHGIIIDERHAQFLVRGTIRNTPGAYAILILFIGKDDAGVNEAARFGAAGTLGIGLDKHSQRDRVRNIFEFGQINALSRNAARPARIVIALYEDRHSSEQPL